MALSGGGAGEAQGEDVLPGKVNYLLGGDPRRWHTDVPTFARVRYAGVYPGVDVVYYGNRRELEYDFVVAPGANAGRIRLNFSGGRGIALAANGDLTLDGASGAARLHKPVLYQQMGGRRRAVAGEFRLLGEHSVGFSVGSYDRTQPLIIDPVLTYSTYLGGSGTGGLGDRGNGIAVDADGNAYVVGTTYSTNFPETGEVLQTTNRASAAGHGGTVFVTKLNAAGTGLVYSTYLGGSGASGGGDYGFGIALDSANHAYVTGATYSTNFPVTCGAVGLHNRAAKNGAATGFVSELNVEGNGLAYSTYLGGSGNQGAEANGDVVQAIAVDATGDAYVTGYTFSADFPVTSGAFQTQFAGDSGMSNAFVSKLSPDGTMLVYSSYLGSGEANGPGEVGNAIAIDASGDAFVVGATNSYDFPVTDGAFQAINNGASTGNSNAFVTKFNPSGTELVYSTYLGGGYSNVALPVNDRGDSAQAVAVDREGYAYVAGTTNATDFPTAAAGVQTWADPVGGTGFVSKLSVDGSTLEYSTYLEGEGTSVSGLAVDGSGNVYVTGSASTANAGSFGGFAATPDALGTPASTGTAAFLVKLNSTATVLNYATLLGGSSSDGAEALALDGAGNVYLTGFANSMDFPASDGAFQTANHAAAASASNAFVSKFALAAEANQTVYPNAQPGIATSLSLLSQTFAWSPDNLCDSFTITVAVNLDTVVSGPAPTGNMDFYGDWENFFETSVSATSGGSSEQDLFGAGEAAGGSYGDWQAVYTGDTNYQGSSLSGTVTVPTCTPGNARSAPAGNDGAVRGQLRVSLVPGEGGLRSGVTRMRLPMHRVKFKLPARAVVFGDGIGEIRPSAQAQSGAACLAPGPPLTVALHSDWKIYGAPIGSFISQPSFYEISGLIGSDSVTVTPTTSVTASSPVGSYPITATVSGPSAANYKISVIGSTFQVTKALLHVEARDAPVVYGNTPAQPTAYVFEGFVNGDTASVVSGAPVLTTNVTSSTPVGVYRIGVQTGTLSAANYDFDPTGNGMGSVQVYKAFLTASATNLTMTQGSAVPALVYSLSGFVNGDSAGSAVTGSPVLTTTATSSSPPGKYPITITLGSLAAANYDFRLVKGVITVLP